MSAKKRISKALALLIPTGVIGISAALATTQAHADTAINIANSNVSIADRLSEIRSAVSSVHNTAAMKSPSEAAPVMLAEWLNVGRGFGWGNGGWHNWGNGGWHNWGNGWHNWGNGGWHNWHNWHNFWHNW
jgi:rSAM-associated Gly-rich repeat protein